MKTTLITSFCLISSVAVVKADGLKGHVYDQQTGEPLVGVTIVLDQSKTVAVTGLDGSFEFKNLHAGKFVLQVSHLSYKPLRREVNLGDKDNPPLNIYMSERSSKSLGEVVVAAGNKAGTEKTARKLEQRSIQQLNVMSGAAIEVSPDLTVANVVQRISGVSVERSSNGDGQYAILRGMDKRYNYTTVNGIKIPSPDNKYRYVPLDIFPSDMLERLEVYKSLTPNMEGDAVGGVVNMVMKDAPDRLQINANLASGYSQMVLDKSFLGFDAGNMNARSPYEVNGKNYDAKAADFGKGTLDYRNKSFAPNVVAGLSLGQRFFNNKLGVMVAGSFQNSYRGTTSTYYNNGMVDTAKYTVITSMQNRQYSEQQQRTGLHNKIDYTINDHNKIAFYQAYMQLLSFQTRDMVTTNFSNGDYNPAAGNAQLTYNMRSRKTNQQIYTANLTGDHKILPGILKVHWATAFSSARNAVPDYTSLSIDGVRKNFTDTKTTPGESTRRWERNTDNDITGLADITYTANIGGRDVDFIAGGLYRDKQRSSFFNNYVLRPANISALYGKDYNNYTDLDWEVQNPKGAVANALTYDASEKIAAGYGMFNYRSDRWEIVGGVRIEHTNQGYHMLFPQGESKPVNNQVYTDVLPSLNLKYQFAKHQQIRGSYFRSVNRPGFFEIVPGKSFQDEYWEWGNADLKRAIADNLDLRYELFPNHSDQLLVGIFYKKIKDPIEQTITADAIRGQDVYYRPGNFGNATNYGLEADYIKFFHNFGIKANYTYTHSRITTDKSSRLRDKDGNLRTIVVQQTRPLYGQSEHIGNLSLLYKDVRRGWDAQVAAAYTGPRINTISQFVDNDLWQKGFVQMDFSIEKRIGSHFSVYGKANNLLNTPATIFIKGVNPENADLPGQGTKNETLIRKEYYKQNYLVGIRYKL